MYDKNLRIDHLNMTVDSLKESVKWYKDIFNFQLVEKGQDWLILKNTNTMLCLYEEKLDKPQDSKNVHKISHFGFCIEDRDKWIETLNAKKLPLFYDSPVKYPNSTSWYIQDPTGHEIEVSYWKN